MNKQNLLGLSFIIAAFSFIFGIVAYDIGLYKAIMVFTSAIGLAVLFHSGIYLMTKTK